MKDRLDTFLLFMLILMFTLAFMNLAYSHDVYRDWMMPDPHARRWDGTRTTSCCDDKDCAPRQAKFDNGRWYVQFNGNWLEVPDNKLETKYKDAWITPDGLAHGCISPGGVIYCFTPPGGAV